MHEAAGLDPGEAVFGEGRYAVGRRHVLQETSKMRRNVITPSRREEEWTKRMRNTDGI